MLVNLKLLNTLKKLKKEYNECKNAPIYSHSFSIGLFEKTNLLKWKIAMFGPKDTPYRDGLFYLELKFSDSYPDIKPDLRFLTPIYHVNVSHQGTFYSIFLNRWNSSMTTIELLTKLYTIFYFQTPESSFDPMKAKEYSLHRALFNSKAEFFTKKYATELQELDIDKKQNWDLYFSSYDYIFNPINLENKEEKIYNNYQYENNNEFISIFFSLNGTSDKKEVKCQLKELTKNVVDIYLKHYSQIPKSKVLYIYNRKKINLDIPIGANSIINNSVIFVIPTSDCMFFV